MKYIQNINILLLVLILFPQEVYSDDRTEMLLKRANQLEQDASTKKEISQADYEEMIGLVIKLGKPSLIDAFIGKVGKVAEPGDSLHKVYERYGNEMWRQDSPAPLLYSYIKFARDLDDDKILTELEKDIFKFKPWKIDDPESPWERTQKHPSRSALSNLVNWLAEEHGVDRVRSLYDSAVSKKRLDIVSVIVGGYLPANENKLEASKLFIYINEDMSTRGNNKWIKDEIKNNALWLENDVYKPLLDLKNIYESK